MSNVVEAAAESVADALAPDIAYLQPTGETHFVGEATLVALGSAVLASFVSGLLAGARDELEEWGRQVGSKLAGWFGEIWLGDEDEVRQDTQSQVSAYRTLVQEKRVGHGLVYEETVTVVIVDSLRAEGLPEASADRAAAAAKEQVRILVSGE